MFGQIHAVFVLADESEDVKNLQEIQILDKSLRASVPNSLLVSFVHSAAGLCQTRVDDGYPAFHIEVFGPQVLRDGLDALDEILNSTSTHSILLKSLTTQNRSTGNITKGIK